MKPGLCGMSAVLLICLLGSAAVADGPAAPQVTGCRGRYDGEIYRFVLDLTAPATGYSLRAEGNRLVVGLPGFTVPEAPESPADGFARLAVVGPAPDGAEVVVQLAYRAPVRAYQLPAIERYPDRLVLDIRYIFEERIETRVGDLTMLEIRRGTAAGPLAAWALTVPPGAGYQIRPLRAEGLETVTGMAARTGALAAVNGGFFDGGGRPLGALAIDGDWQGYPVLRRTALYVDRGGKAVLGYEPSFSAPVFFHPEEIWHCLGGGPRLVAKGLVRVDAEGEIFRSDVAVGLAPRTAVGLRKDGSVVLLVVDGRQPGHSRGLTLRETALLMKELGAVEAMNLDGGGSSTMYAGGRTVNLPSGGTERRVASGLGVFALPAVTAERGGG